MADHCREWLVRTRDREVLGPFTENELREALGEGKFSSQDELAKSHSSWFSAIKLTQRDSDEVTGANTKTDTLVTPSPITNSYPPVSAQESLNPRPSTPSLPHSVEKSQLKSSNSRVLSIEIAGPLFSTIVVLVIVWAVLYHVGSREPGVQKQTTLVDIESPFIQRISSLVRTGERKAAIKELTEYHSKPTGERGLEYLIPFAALLITESDSLSQARKYLDQILKSDSRPQLKARAHHWLGYLMLKEEEGDLGENHFLEALQLNPKDAASRFNLGRTYLKQERFNQALDYLQLAELEVPDLWLVHIYKGRARLSLGYHEEAGLSFKAAIQNGEDRWLSYIYNALFLTRTQQYSAAQAVLKKMLTRDPYFEINSPAPFGFYQEKTDYSEYLTAYSEVMKRTPASDRELGKLYLSYLQKGPNGAESKRIEALASSDRFAKIIALRVLLDRDAKEDELKAAIENLPSDLSDFGYYAHVLQAEVYWRLGQAKEAESSLKKAQGMDPKAAISRLAYAIFLRRTQRVQEAQVVLKALLSFHPVYVPGLRALNSIPVENCLLCE